MSYTLEELAARVADIVGPQDASWMNKIKRWIDLRYQEIAKRFEWKDLCEARVLSKPARNTDWAWNVDANTNVLFLPQFVDKVYALSNRTDDLFLLKDSIMSRESRFVGTLDSSTTASSWAYLGDSPVLTQPGTYATKLDIYSVYAADVGFTVTIKGRGVSGETGPYHSLIDVSEDLICRVTVNSTAAHTCLDPNAAEIDWTEIYEISKDKDTEVGVPLYWRTGGTSLIAAIIPPRDRQSKYKKIKLNAVGYTGYTGVVKSGTNVPSPEFVCIYKRRVNRLQNDLDSPQINGVERFLIHGAAADALMARRRSGEAETHFAILGEELDRMEKEVSDQSDPRIVPKFTYRELV